MLYQDEESNGASLSCSIRRGVKAGRDLQVTRCLSTTRETSDCAKCNPGDLLKFR